MIARFWKATALTTWLAGLVLLVSAPGGYGQGWPGTAPPAFNRQAQLNTRLRSLLDAAVRRALPGVSLRASGPGIDFRGAAGVANLATGEPLTTDHAMYVASLGKTFTATIALQLCEEGSLELDSPITTWLPRDIAARIPSSDKITLRHLLGHRSGLIDYLNDDEAWRRDFVKDPRRPWSNRDVALYLLDRPLLFEPGTEFRYSNSNYILAGIIIERVTGRPLHALIRERILDPLDLQHSFHGHEAVETDKLVHGYVRWRGRRIDTFPWFLHEGLADSGMRSTPDDISRFLRSLLTKDVLLSEAMRAELTRMSASGYPASSYGLGLYVHRDLWGHRTAYTHDGVDPGYEADMLYFPDLDLTIVICANGSLGPASRTYEQLLSAVICTVLHAAHRLSE